MDSTPDGALARLEASGFLPTDAFEALAGIIHIFNVGFGFTCVTEQGSNVPGFAPSLRELSKSELFPPLWSSLLQERSVLILYKHKLCAGKVFQIVLLEFEDRVIITASVRGGSSQNFEISCSDYFLKRAELQSMPEIKESFLNLQTLSEIVKGLWNQLCPQLFKSTQNDMKISDQQYIVPPLMAQPPSSVPQQSVPWNVGSSDLDPFQGVGLPRLGVPPANHSGSLVGPNHSIFQPNGPNFPAFGEGNEFFPNFGFNVPQPRFDPYGPVVGPNSNFDLDPNRSKFRNGRPPFPGEPNPDHQKPPGW